MTEALPVLEGKEGSTQHQTHEWQAAPLPGIAPDLCLETNSQAQQETQCRQS